MDKDDSLPLIGKKVLVREVSQYGATVLEPANALAREFANIAKTKTMTLATVSHIKRMGLTVQTTGESPRQL